MHIDAMMMKVFDIKSISQTVSKKIRNICRPCTSSSAASCETSAAFGPLTYTRMANFRTSLSYFSYRSYMFFFISHIHSYRQVQAGKIQSEMSILTNANRGHQLDFQFPMHPYASYTPLLHPLIYVGRKKNDRT